MLVGIYSTKSFFDQDCRLLFNPSGLLFISHFLSCCSCFSFAFFSFFFALFSCCLLLLESCRGVASPPCDCFYLFFGLLFVCRICAQLLLWLLAFPSHPSFFFLLKSFCLENSGTGATVRVQTDHDGAVVRHPPSWADLKFKNSSRKISFFSFLFFLFLFLFLFPSSTSKVNRERRLKKINKYIKKTLTTYRELLKVIAYFVLGAGVCSAAHIWIVGFLESV